MKAKKKEEERREKEALLEENKCLREQFSKVSTFQALMAYKHINSMSKLRAALLMPLVRGC